MSKKNILLPFVLIPLSLFFSCQLEAKRTLPRDVEPVIVKLEAKRTLPDVDPVIFKGVKYVVPERKSRCVDTCKTLSWFIEAYDAQSGKKLWDLDVYKKTIDPNLEADVQHVFITKLGIFGNNKLLVTDERGETYAVELKENNTKPQKVDRIFISWVRNSHQPKSNPVRRNIAYVAIALVIMLILFGAFFLLKIKKK